MSAAADSRRPPPLAAVARAQLGLLLGRRPRGMWIALAIVVAQIVAAGAGGIIFGITIQTGPDQPSRILFSRVSDFSDELGFAIDEGAAAVALAAAAALLWAFFFPYRVWREERPQRRDYHWAMPVDRRTHDLVRLGVGLALMPALTALFALLAVAVASLFGYTAVFPTWGALFWVNLFAAPPLVYLLVSIPAVGSRHPAAWLWGTIGVGALLGGLLQAAGLSALLQAFLALLLGRFGLLTTLGGPMVSEVAGWEASSAGAWLAAWLGWMALAAAGVWLAASRRHRSI